MPKLLSDDGDLAKVQLDDGTILPVAKSAAPSSLDFLQNIQNMGDQFSRAPSSAESAVQMAGWDYNPASVRFAESAMAGQEDPMKALAASMDARKKALDAQISQDAQKQSEVDALKSNMGIVTPDQTGMTGASVLGPNYSSAYTNTIAPQTPQANIGSATDAIVKNTELKDPFEAAFEAAGALRKSGIADKAKADAEGFRQAAKIHEEGIKIYDQLAQQEAAKRDMLQQTLQQRAQALDAAVEDARNAKIEGWANASTGTKIMAGIAIALGGFGQAFGGGENQGLKVINQAIDRDIELQKANAAQKQQYVGNLTNSYNRMKELGADDVQATLAMKVNALQKTKMQLEKVQATTQSQEALANAKMLSGEIDMKVAELRQEAAQKAAEQFQKSYKPERYIPGLGYAEYGTDGDVSKAREAYADTQSIVQGLDQLLALSKKGQSRKLPWSEVKAQAQQIREPLKYQLKKIFADSAGKISAADEKLIDVADPTDFISVNDEAKLNTLKQRVLQKLAPQLQGIGIKYQPPKQMVTPSGTYEEVQPGQYRKVY